MNQGIYRVYQGLAWVVFVGIVLQFFLAGIGVFEKGNFGEGNFGPHRTVGELLIYASIVLLILAGASFVTGNPDRWRVGLAALLVVLLLLQYLLVLDSLQESAPVISALHPVNGLLLVFVSYALAHGRGLPWTGRPRTGEGAASGGSRVR